jgi:hypothetical protein
MALTEIGLASSWTAAFETARKLLVQDKLTAVAVVSESEYARGRYIATHLDEFSAVFGCIDKVLDNLETMSPMLYKKATRFRLFHGALQYPRPEGLVDGWLLAIIYNN